MSRKLTPQAIQKLNALLAQGVPFDDAMAQASSWEEVEPRDDDGTPKSKAPPPRPDTTIEQVHQQFDTLFTALDEEGIVPRDGANGCSWEEIEKLERDTQRVFPRAYAHFLHRVGKARTRLISHNHIAAELHHLRAMQRSGARFMAERKLSMPPEALFILSVLGDAYHYVVCDDDDAIDAVVWITQGGWDEPRACYDSVISLVEDLARESRRAWANGYFAARPEGTSA